MPLPGQWLQAKVWRKSENKLWTWNRACGSRLLQEREASGEAAVTFQAILWVTAWKELRRKSIPYLSPFLLQWQWLRLFWQLNNGKCQGVFPSSHPEETLCPWYIAHCSWLEKFSTGCTLSTGFLWLLVTDFFVHWQSGFLCSTLRHRFARSVPMVLGTDQHRHSAKEVRSPNWLPRLSVHHVCGPS